MMAPNKLDDTAPGTEPAQSDEPGANGAPPVLETVPEPPPPPDFDATPWPVASRPAPRPLRVSRPWGPRLWTATLAAALLFTAGRVRRLFFERLHYPEQHNPLQHPIPARERSRRAAEAPGRA